MITSPQKRHVVEELETVWTPHRHAASLLGEGYGGCCLSGYMAETRAPKTERVPYSRKRANRDFAYYAGTP